MEKINENIAEFRELRGWSRRLLADLMRKAGTDIGETAIRRIENGQREVRIAEGISFAEVFQTTLDALANERPNTYKIALDKALASVGELHSDLLFDIEEFADALAYLKSVRDAIPNPYDDDAPVNISTADLVISEGKGYYGKLGDAYKALHRAGLSVGAITEQDAPKSNLIGLDELAKQFHLREEPLRTGKHFNGDPDGSR